METKHKLPIANDIPKGPPLEAVTVGEESLSTRSIDHYLERTSGLLRETFFEV